MLFHWHKSNHGTYVCNVCLQETGPTHELQVRVEGLSVKTVKVEEDVRMVRDEVGGVEGRLCERLQKVEKNLQEVKSLLEQLVVLKSQPQEV